MSRTVILKLFLVAYITPLVCGCTPTSSLRPPPLPASSDQKSNLTPAMVKKHIVLGSTTQTEILGIFGAPNVISRDKAGREVWTYDVQSVASSSAATGRSGTVVAGGAGIAGPVPIVGGGSASGSEQAEVGQISSATFTLMITFDRNEVVEDYRMQSTKF